MLGPPVFQVPSLAAWGTSQLILVTARLSRAQVVCADRTPDGIWTASPSVGAVSGCVGRNGIRADKREGDGSTPAGLFRLGYAFGCRVMPETSMPYRRITDDSFWVDDPASRFYNTWVESPGPADWSSAERLSCYPDSYAYAVVIEYNMRPVVPGRGSAVFLHCGESPTAGCVAVPEHAMLGILKWLDPAKAPAIYITGSPAASG